MSSTLCLGTNDECLHPNGEILESVIDIGSDKYQVWPNNSRCVCHLHKSDDPSCDF